MEKIPYKGNGLEERQEQLKNIKHPNSENEPSFGAILQNDFLISGICDIDGSNRY